MASLSTNCTSPGCLQRAPEFRKKYLGYKEFTKVLAAERNLPVFCRFDGLSIHVLLAMQDEHGQIEKSRFADYHARMRSRPEPPQIDVNAVETWLDNNVHATGYLRAPTIIHERRSKLEDAAS
ncbi:hypothetical protein BDW68DRAFT_183375 [Aspergillus falconensis]